MLGMLVFIMMSMWDTLPPFDTQDLPQMPHHVDIIAVSLRHVKKTAQDSAP